MLSVLGVSWGGGGGGGHPCSFTSEWKLETQYVGVNFEKIVSDIECLFGLPPVVKKFSG